MAKTIEDLFVLIAFITDIAVVLLFFIYYNRCKNHKPLKIIIAYCLVSLLTNSLIEFISFDNVSLLYSYFTLAEYLLFASYIFTITSSKRFKRFMIICSGLFLLALIYHTYTTSIRSLDSVPIGIETILILIYSFNYLYEQMSEIDNTFVYNKPSFWIVTGIMIYLAGSFFIYVFANQVEKAVLNQFWFLTNVLYVVKNLLFALGIFIHVKQSNNPTPQKLRPYLN